MGIYYLQQLRPPILPPIQALQENLSVEESEYFQNWNIGFNSSYSFKESGRNSSEVIELVRGFFAFYGHLKPENIILCPLIGSELVKEQLTSHDAMKSYAANIKLGMRPLNIQQFTIQDPFELSFNPVSSVQKFPVIQKLFLRAEKICKSIMNLECDDGLVSLFHLMSPTKALSKSKSKESFKSSTKVTKVNLNSPSQELSESSSKECLNSSTKERLKEPTVEEIPKQLEYRYNLRFEFAPTK